MTGDRRDAFHMARALALAERGRGTTSPNPMVGAVVVDAEGVVVGRGSHAYAGGPHAEIHALAEAGDRARGATLYCTLEPCSHTGRTGPCAPRVVEAGIRRAVVAVEDPNPLVAGRGLAHLREHGVEVVVGPLGDAAKRLNLPFFTRIRRGRPFVTMKVAVSRDRRVAAAPGVRTALTGAAANRLIHRERAEVDALAIGSGTLLSDDPRLTARGAYRKRPLVRVVFDRALRTPPTARVLGTLDAGPVVIATTEPSGEEARQRARGLQAAGARIDVIGATGDLEFLRAALARLADGGVNSLVLEGGPAIHRAAWQAGLVDRVQVFRTPACLGEGGLLWLNEDEISLGNLDDFRTIPLGSDVMIEGYVHRID